jgi:ABC-type cobalamin/Fe3+-siderophores transport system ATPase subunit
MITKILIYDYKQFIGQQELIPAKHLTMIFGRRGSGKTNLYNGIQKSIIGENFGVTVEHQIPNCDIYQELMFLNDEHLSSNSFPANYISFLEQLNKQQKKHMANRLWELLITSEQQGIHSFGLTQKSSIDQCIQFISEPTQRKNWLPCTTRGQRILVNFCFYLSLREVISKGLPLILDDPFKLLRHEEKAALMELVQRVPNQILFFSKPIWVNEIIQFNRLYVLYDKVDYHQSKRLSRDETRMFIRPYDKTKQTTITPQPILQGKQMVSGVNISFVTYELFCPATNENNVDIDNGWYE